MKIAEAKLSSISPYSQSRYYKADRLPKELHADYEDRTWRERCHVNTTGEIFIPPMAFANSLKESAKYLSLPIPGRGKSTFTKHFEAGVLVTDGVALGIQKEDVIQETVFVPSDGKRGGGSRVEKHFPLITSWTGTVAYYITDDLITEDVFKQVLDVSGELIGIGRFRPRNWGYYGRFKVESLEWITR